MEKEMAIAAGSTVQLKSGGPTMTVEWVDEGTAGCTWFDDRDNHNQKNIEVAALKEVAAD